MGGMSERLIRSVFLSTLSLRRATIRKCQIIPIIQNFYPRSPCGERRPVRYAGDCTATNFYPRSPCGERRFRLRRTYLDTIISIHALLAESDRTPPYNLIIHQPFLSTLSLRRATVGLPRGRFPVILFLSTLSLRRATQYLL